MLIEFTVSNWRSIKNAQTLSLVKAKGDELEATNTFEPGAPATPPLLRSAAIYGPNAAGKSNLLRALIEMQNIVVGKFEYGDLLPLQPFRLSTDTDKAPTEFELTFIVNHVRYQYGFSATVERVYEEWLFAYPSGRPQKWFGRSWNDQKQAYEWEKCSALTGRKRAWQDATRQNELFLKRAVQDNSLQLQPIYDWFRNTLCFINISGARRKFTASLCQEPHYRQKILKFLKAADLGIEDISIQEEQISATHFPNSIPEQHLHEFIAQLDEGEKKLLNVSTVHKSMDGYLVDFSIYDESDGTQKLFEFAGPWFDVLSNGHVLLVDELHAHLHPKIVGFLLSLFHNSKSNPKNAQLIFTTHETSILNQEVLRRDQVWLCEKNNEQATIVYPLTDFHPRKGRENIEANYLAGRYGALPYITEFPVTSEG